MNAVDSNVLVYACDKSHPEFQHRALQLIGDMPDAVLLWQVACEFIAACRKLANQGFTPSAAWLRLAELIELMPLRFPTQRTLDRAREFQLDQQWSFWDALIVSACLDAGVTRLYSEDLPGRKPPAGLEIINPFA